MARQLLRYILTTALLAVLLPTVLWGKDIPTIRVAAFNYYPAIFLDSDNKIRGFYVDMLNEVAEREQIRFEYVFGSWNEGLERLRSGEVDLVTSAAYTKERATFMDYGQQVLLTVWGELYIPQDTPTAPIRELQDQPIAVMRSDYNARSFKEHLDKFGISSHFIEFADFAEVFTAIRDKQVSAGVVNSVFGDAAAEQYEVHSSGISFNPFDIYFATAKGQDGDLLSLLDDYLLKWRNDDASVYYQARLKWGAEQEPEKIIPAWVVKLAAVAALVLLSCIVFILLLRHRVNRATHELQKSNNMIRLLLNSTAEGIFGLDPQGLCTFCNAACVRILGFDNAEQILGRNMHDLIHHSHADSTSMSATEDKLLKGMNQKIHSDNEVFWRTDGNSFPVEYWSYPIRQDEKVAGMVVSFVDITERQRTEEALRESEATFRKLFEDSSDAILLIDISGVFVECNQAALDLLKMTRKQFISLSTARISPKFQPDGRRSDEAALDLIAQAYSKGLRRFDWTHVDAAGSEFIVEVSIMPITLSGQTLLHTSWRDITERKQAEEALKLERDNTRNILATVDAMIIALGPEGRITLVNRKACEILGYREDELLGQDWFATCLPHSIDVDQVRAVFKMGMAGNLAGSEYYENPVRTHSGEERLIAWHNSSIRDKDGNIIGGLSAGVDITERKQAQLALEQKTIELQAKNSLLDSLSKTDQLTGIANRRWTQQIIEQEIDRFNRYKKPLCIFLFDIDYFKTVNDIHGHEVGDQVLVELVGVVQSVIRRTDTFGRWGGEEFILVCPETSLPTAQTIAGKLCTTVREYEFTQGLGITLSIGVSEFQSGANLKEILVEVDQKMYLAKQKGRDRVET